MAVRQTEGDGYKEEQKGELFTRCSHGDSRAERAKAVRARSSEEVDNDCEPQNIYCEKGVHGGHRGAFYSATGADWPPYRIYVPEIGPFDVIAFEFEFENLQEYERAWAEWFGAPDAPDFMAKWYDLTEPGGTNEIWTLAE